MKTKQKAHKANNETSMLVESFADFAKNKNIDRPTTMKILEEVFRTIIRKKYQDDSNFDVIINIEKGDLEIFRMREIMDDEFIEDSFDYNPNKHISLAEAKLIEPDFEIGEEVSERIDIETFGRRMVLVAKQSLMQKIKDYDNDQIIERYKDLVGEIITGEVYSYDKGSVLLVDGQGIELRLPKAEQIRGDRFTKGMSVRAIVNRVDINNGKPVIFLSRTSSVFLEKLFEIEVPEVYDGLISIKRVVREPGEKAKVAVESYDDRIDPVGACVGVKGVRINGIVRELNNEQIDVVPFTENRDLFIQRSLQPAKVSDIKVENGKATAYIKPEEVAKAIGRRGVNIKLASKLVGMPIEIFREGMIIDEEDVDLMEFSDEIESWIIDELKKIGLDTAKQVLATDIDDLVKRTDLEEETILDVIDILKEEFE